MLSFKQWLFETRFKKAKIKLDQDTDVTDIEVYKNPSGGDWDKLPSEARGIITEAGDLYLVTQSGTFDASGWFIHHKIITFLSAVLPINDTGTRFAFVKLMELKFIPIQQYLKTKKFYVSESMSKSIYNDEKQKEYAKQVFKRGEKKNSGIKFFFRSIAKAI